MKVAMSVADTGIGHAGQAAARLERLGFDCASSPDVAHDAFLPLAAAACRTSRIELRTNIAVAFARTPMLLAILANDIQILSEGRFTLGLGTQVKAHITRRFDMPWSHPARRIAEMVDAIRAIWTSWETGEKLDFHGDFYNNSLMTPTFSPQPHDYGRPRIVLAAVGALMTEATAAVSDGLMPHSFSNEKFFREVSLPAVQRGLARSGRARDDFQINAPSFVVTGATEESLASEREKMRRQISFYGSTPAYRQVFEVHGWGPLGDELHQLSVGDDPNRWDVMADLIDDDVLHSFAIVAEPSDVAAAILARYGDVADAISLRIPVLPDEDIVRIIGQLHASSRQVLARARESPAQPLLGR
jgi:probable F420-dependent oxidoreductase